MTVLRTSSGIFSHFFLFLLIKILTTKNSILALDFLSLFDEMTVFCHFQQAPQTGLLLACRDKSPLISQDVVRATRWLDEKEVMEAVHYTGL